MPFAEGQTTEVTVDVELREEEVATDRIVEGSVVIVVGANAEDEDPDTIPEDL